MTLTGNTSVLATVLVARSIATSLAPPACGAENPGAAVSSTHTRPWPSATTLCTLRKGAAGSGPSLRLMRASG
ncbi:hypothetical protein G6F56_014504 [Rhizopus delemar]|nr:hypothetical protein G6F56_014504 [Rhizopus delemar]